YQAGVFLSGSVNYIFSNWRHAFFVGSLPALLVILLRMTLKESDKWLAHAHGHSSEDEKIPSGEFSKSLMKELFSSKNTKSLLIGGLSFGALLIGYWASLSWIPTWIQSLLTDQSSSIERSIATMVQGFAAIIGCSSAGFLCDWIGRKKTLLLSFLGCFGASCLLFMTNVQFTNLVYWQVALLGYFIGLSQATLYIYLPELFNTKVRASGTGFCLNVGRLVTIISVLFVGTLVALFGGYGKAAFAFSFAYLLGSVLCLFASETKGKILPV
ncbi:MAG: MFS transporter, partial [Candidatus Caenarcaniphilales bacterium]|nr:MFS transporter [Candidatus Caenarcaniphilales bacterium]